MEKIEFRISINGGPEQMLKANTGVYAHVACAACAILDFEDAADGQNLVKIWVDNLLPNYGPYYYLVNDQGEVFTANPEYLRNLNIEPRPGLCDDGPRRSLAVSPGN